MGIYDRDYMRDPPPSRVLPNLFWLGLALAIGLICVAVGFHLLRAQPEGNPAEPREKHKVKKVKRFALAEFRQLCEAGDETARDREAERGLTSLHCSTASNCYIEGAAP